MEKLNATLQIKGDTHIQNCLSLIIYYEFDEFYDLCFN